MTHIVTDSLLQDHLNCQSNSYLRLHGRSGQVSDYAALCSQLDARHLASASWWLEAQSIIGNVSRFDGSRLEHMATADAIILEAVGVTDGLETHFHAIERIPGDSKLGPFHYQPIRLCRSLRPSSTVHLLLAFDAFILGHLQGVCPDVGILLCGPAFRRSCLASGTPQLSQRCIGATSSPERRRSRTATPVEQTLRNLRVQSTLPTQSCRGG